MPVTTSLYEGSESTTAVLTFSFNSIITFGKDSSIALGISSATEVLILEVKESNNDVNLSSELLVKTSLFTHELHTHKQLGFDPSHSTSVTLKLTHPPWTQLLQEWQQIPDLSSSLTALLHSLHRVDEALELFRSLRTFAITFNMKLFNVQDELGDLPS